MPDRRLAPGHPWARSQDGEPTNTCSTRRSPIRAVAVASVRGGGVSCRPSRLLRIIAVIVAVIGIIVLISGSIIWGIVLLIVAALIGPGGYSIFRGRTR